MLIFSGNTRGFNFYSFDQSNPFLRGAQLRFTIFSLFTGPELEREILTKYYVTLVIAEEVYDFRSLRFDDELKNEEKTRKLRTLQNKCLECIRKEFRDSSMKRVRRGQIGKFDVRGGLIPRALLSYPRARTRNQQRETFFQYFEIFLTPSISFSLNSKTLKR